ncbi:J domain-containing protein [Siculibacillus lacustris]|uniref:J domain-containing protein n=1 Tax=Siculibacillus lacustris TaxID=1549641 RepID=A0A4Q9VHL7_9HYPH|nr:DnaJ C-terminal domain-containing protein [Siculibacillus lacustris]TBW34511.1 J domain-containing protein [Siculibacillus lacustris]
MRDPYDVLGVGRSASADEIKKAFRRLAKKHHPDQNRNDPKAKEAFAELNSAYEILGDGGKRAQFDRGEIDAEGKPKFSAGPGGFDFRGGGPFGGGRGGPRGGHGAEPPFDDFLTDILGQAFGGGRAGFGRGPGMGAGAAGPGAGAAGAKTRGRGDDVEVQVPVSLEEVASHAKVRVELPSGRSLDVQLPEGVVDRQQIRLKGQGQPGATPGDALVTVVFRRHPQFQVDGHDLEVDVPVSLDEAALGGRVRVTTLDGVVELTLPAGTTCARALRLKGKGLPNKTGGRGDLYAKPRIVLSEGGDAELEAFLRARRAR